MSFTINSSAFTAMHGHILGQAVVVGTYQKQR